MPDSSAGFGGGIEIIDSDSLATLLDADPREQVDARAYLKARLIAMLVNDWDRHAGNWKWARMESDGMWQPIARDRDRVMTTYGGFPGTAVAGELMPQLIRFENPYARMSGLTWNSIDLDRRLLSGLEVSAFDSVAIDLVRHLTNAVIDSALLAMPPEYRAKLPKAAAKLKSHRDLLPEQAKDFYKLLAEVVDIHATDADDRAIVTLVDEHHVESRFARRGRTLFPASFRRSRHSSNPIVHAGGNDWAEVATESRRFRFASLVETVATN